MKLFCVITVARQVDGEFVFIQTQKAFKQASQADGLRDQLNKNEYHTPDGKPKPVFITTPQGSAQCICLAGAFELEVVE